MNKIAKILLVTTSFAPIILTYAFVIWVCDGSLITIVSLLAVVVFLVIICLALLKFAKTQIEVQKIEITSISSADGEVLGFVIAYLLPILSLTNPSIDFKVILFIGVMFLIVIWSTNSYHVNPLINMFGYHFYEISSNDNISYLLLTKKELRKTTSIKSIIHITEYMILDAED